MVNSDQKLGVWGIPGTFPTAYMGRAIYSTSGNLWERSKINRLYYWYKEAITKHGLQPFEEGNVEIGQWIAENSEYELNDVRIFMYVLLQEVQNEKIDLYFWNFKEPSTSIVNIVKDIDPQKIFNKFLWIAGISVAGMVLWYGGPVIARQFKKRKK